MEESKEVVAERLAQSHAAIDAGLRLVVRLLAPRQQETDPDEPIKLLEVNDNTVENGIWPLYFGPSAESGITYPSVIIEVTPSEYERIARQPAVLPDGWEIGPEVFRAEAVSAE